MATESEEKMRSALGFRAVVFLYFIVLLLSGCSKTKTVGVMGPKASIGQHLDCFYAKENLYCLPASTSMIDGIRLDAWRDKDGKQIPRQDILLSMSVDVVHTFEQGRPRANKDPEVDMGNYETKFAGSPSDYSLWDCFRTGVGSPAISCTLQKAPQGKLKDRIKEQESEAAQDNYLRTLTPETLGKRCGAANKVTNDSISFTHFYTTTSGMPLSFRFDTLSSKNFPSIDVIETEEEKDARAAKHIFWWQSSRHNLEEAGLIMREFPCLDYKKGGNVP